MNYPDKIWCKFWSGTIKYIAEYVHKKKENEEGYYMTGEMFVVFPEEYMDKSKEEIKLRLAIRGVDEEWYYIKKSFDYSPFTIGIEVFNKGWIKSKKLEI